MGHSPSRIVSQAAHRMGLWLEYPDQPSATSCATERVSELQVCQVRGPPSWTNPSVQVGVSLRHTKTPQREGRRGHRVGSHAGGAKGVDTLPASRPFIRRPGWLNLLEATPPYEPPGCHWYKGLAVPSLPPTARGAARWHLLRICPNPGCLPGFVQQTCPAEQAESQTQLVSRTLGRIQKAAILAPC